MRGAAISIFTLRSPPATGVEPVGPAAEAPAESTTTNTRRWQRIDRLEVIVALVLTAVALWARASFALHAGVLWRDEANSASVASMPTWPQVYAMMEHDSFPVAWIALTRAWMRWGPGDSQASLRALGFVLSASLLPALWWTARQFGIRPLLTMVILGLSPTFIVWAGGTHRAYGLGMLLLVVLYGLLWRCARAIGADDRLSRSVFPQSRRRILLATLSVALLSVHTLYHAPPALLAISCGAMVVIVLARRSSRPWPKALAGALPIIAIGCIAAATLLVYVPIWKRRSAWNALASYQDFDVAWLLRDWWAAVGGADAGSIRAWQVLLSVSLAIFILTAISRLRRASGGAAEAPAGNAAWPDWAILFAGTTTLLAMLIHGTFLLRLKYVPHPWYYCVPMLMTALGIEVILGAAAHRARPGSVALRWVRLLGVLLLATIFAPGAQAAAHTRLTNIDVAARYIEAHASPQDLVVVCPWHYGVSFARQYRGHAEWMMLPDLPRTGIHRYDLVKQLMFDPDAPGPALKRIGGALRAGHAVWLVGALPPSIDERRPLPPPPRNSTGWTEWPYTESWNAQLGHYLHVHVPHKLQETRLPIPEDDVLSGFEDVDVFRIEGWQP